MPGMICGMLGPFDPDSFIVPADVHILGIGPKISRTLELPITLNLAQLHEVLQAAFGWTDSHLHQFNIDGLIYGAPEFDEDGLSDSRTFEATEVRMIDLHFRVLPVLLQLYRDEERALRSYQPSRSAMITKGGGGLELAHLVQPRSAFDPAGADG